MKRNIIIIVISVFLTNCTTKLPNVAGNSILINTNIDKVEKTSIENVFEEIEPIILETIEESLIKRIGKIDVFEGNYYILDDLRNIIFVFDSLGTFIISSERKMGRGPQEYGCIIDFTIDKDSKNIHILDASSYKICVYDEHFNYVREYNIIKELYPISNFALLNKDNYVFYSSPDADKGEFIRFYSADKQEILSVITPQKEIPRHLGKSQTYPFIDTPNGLFFSSPFPSSQLIQIDKSTCKTKIYAEWDFGQRSFDFSKIPENYPKDFMMENSGKFAFPIFRFANRVGIYSFVYYKNHISMCVYNYDTNETKVLDTVFKDNSVLIPPKFVDEDYMYVVAEPEHIPMLFPNDIAYLEKAELLLKLNDYSNPVILKYKIKKPA